jgi:predicted ATP-dependent endonuclease of OLD family
MISDLFIKNIQSHKETVLQFSKGVNAIVGLPNSGKTAILRSLLMLINNKPGGSQWFSYFAGDKGTMEVKATFDDKLIQLIRHIRTTKKGEKVVDSSGYYLDKESFEGMRSSVPDLVKQVVNMDDLNIHEQHDSPFLITGSGGEIARTINKITQVDEADEWVSQLTTRINKTKHSIDLINEDVKEKQIKAADLSYLDKLRPLVERLEGLENDINYLCNRKASLQKYAVNMENFERDISLMDHCLQAESLLSQAKTLYDEEQFVQQKIDLFVKVDSLSQSIWELDRILGQIGPVMENLLTIEINTDKLDRFQSLATRFERTVKSLEEIEEDYEGIKEEFIQEIISTGECPFCYNNISKENAKKIKESL